MVSKFCRDLAVFISSGISCTHVPPHNTVGRKINLMGLSLELRNLTAEWTVKFLSTLLRAESSSTCTTTATPPQHQHHGAPSARINPGESKPLPVHSTIFLGALQSNSGTTNLKRMSYCGCKGCNSRTNILNLSRWTNPPTILQHTHTHTPKKKEKHNSPTNIL